MRKGRNSLGYDKTTSLKTVEFSPGVHGGVGTIDGLKHHPLAMQVVAGHGAAVAVSVVEDTAAAAATSAHVAVCSLRLQEVVTTATAGVEERLRWLGLYVGWHRERIDKIMRPCQLSGTGVISRICRRCTVEKIIKQIRYK